MSNNCEDELHDGNLVDDDVFSEICVKYSNLKHELDNVNEDKNKLSNIIYKNYVPKNETKDTNFVLSQINQNVDLLESSGFCVPLSKIYKAQSAKDVSSTFLAFADLDHGLNENDLNSQDKIFSDSEQWDNNTQIAQIADNIDALTFLINCKENLENAPNISNENKSDEKILLSDLKDTDLNDFQNENIFPTSPVIHVSQTNNNIEEYAEGSKKIKRKRTQSQKVKSDFLPNNKQFCDVNKIDLDGFGTGKNKKNRISDDALNKVKDIFSDIDSIFTKEINTNNIDSISNSAKKGEQRVLPDCEEKSDENVQPYKFKTASNKNITISSDALNKAKSIFADLDLTNEKDSKIICGDIISNNKNEIDDIDFNSEDSKAIDEIEKSFGFMTGNNKKIVVSEDSLNKAKAIFMDVNIEMNGQNKFEHLNSNSISCEEKETEKISLKDFGQIEETFGFMTANNKKISVSDDALNKAKSIFKDIDLDINEENSSDKRNLNVSNVESENKEIGVIPISSKVFSNVESFGFMTGNNKKISVSENALSKAKAIFKDINSDSTSCNENYVKNFENNEKTFSFTTANNIKISVSDDALNKAKNIFKDFNLDTNVEKCFQKKNLNVITSTKSKCEEIDTNPAFSNNIESFGFTTGNNRKISVSSNALNKAKAIFNDFKLDTYEENNSQKKNQDVILCTKSKCEEIDTNPKFSNSIESFGFTTGNNRKISVSTNALNKAKAIFNDLDLKMTEKNGSVNTALNSDHVNERGFDEIDSKDVIKVEKTFGFTTANNKKIKISDEALNKAKIAFSELESFETDKVNLNSKNSFANVEPFKTNKITETNKSSECEPENHIEKIYTNNQNVCEKIYNEKNVNKISKYDVPSLQSLSTKVIMNDETWFPKQKDESKPMNSVENKEIISMCQNDNYIENFNSPSSPIIQTKKPIKRKKMFKVPYRKENILSQDLSVDKKPKLDDCTQNRLIDVPDFTEKVHLGSLKTDKHNRNVNAIKLKDLNRNFSVNKELSQMEPDILMLTPQNFDQFVFKENRVCKNIVIQKNAINIDDIVKIFEAHTDINEKLIPKGWVYNHIKWIIWKLASYERTYTNNELILTVPNVLKQLKYRYDRELCDGERPILRKILEKDDVPTKRMVLCVSNIIEVEKNADEKNDRYFFNFFSNIFIHLVFLNFHFDIRILKPKYEVELTDGWYDMTASIDSFLSSMIDKKKIIVGTKLIMSGAELLNCPQGISPLEVLCSYDFKIYQKIIV